MQNGRPVVVPIPTEQPERINVAVNLWVNYCGSYCPTARPGSDRAVSAPFIQLGNELKPFTHAGTS